MTIPCFSPPWSEPIIFNSNHTNHSLFFTFNYILPSLFFLLLVFHPELLCMKRSMAACGSLHHIFEKPLPENPTLFQTLSSWNQKKIIKPIDDSSFTELFGELHFKESNHHYHHHNHDGHESFSSSSPSSSMSFSDANNFPHQSASWIEMPNKGKAKNDKADEGNKSPSSCSSAPACYYPSSSQSQSLNVSQRRQYRHSDSFSSMNSESLSLCTEGLGFESSDDVEELIKNESANSSTDWQQQQPEEEEMKNTISGNNGQYEYMYCEHKRLCSRGSNSNRNRGPFPPPISCIGRNGKPWVCFKSYRKDGRFILQEIRVPTQEFLHACREDGRLTLQFVQSDDEFIEEDDEDDFLEDIEEADEAAAAAAASDDDEEHEKNAEGEHEGHQKNFKIFRSNSI